MKVEAALIIGITFVSVTLLVFAATQLYLERARLGRRLTTDASSASFGARTSSGFSKFVTGTFTEERFGVDTTVRQKLRRELLRAGFFSPDAVRYYVMARFATVAAAPLLVYALILLFAPALSRMLGLLSVSVAAGIGILLPDAFLSRRRGRMMNEYRLIFPDLLDLLLVCMSAGLSIEASMERIRGHMSKRSEALGLNLELMGAELRAGRDSIDVLNSLADRLGIDEAASFVAVLRHSMDLGGDISESLRVFSDEMRRKRILRAEEKANALPVKMVGPLAAGIFPVILLVALLPVILKLMKVFHNGG